MGAEEQGEGAFNGGLKKWAQDVILFGRKKVGGWICVGGGSKGGRRAEVKQWLDKRW